MKLITACVFLLLCSPLTALPFHKLSVNGNVVLHKSADQLSIKVGVVSNDREVEPAIKSNNESLQRILAALMKIGLTEKDVQTGTFSVTPTYSQPPKEITGDWRPTIVGYEVRNTLQIHTEKLELAGNIIDVASKNGSNLIEDISFSLKNKQDAESEAIANAVQQAIVYAEAAAKGASVQLGDVVEIAIHPSAVTPKVMRAERFALSNEALSTPIVPGDVDVTASVSLIYEIRHPRH